MKQTNQPLCTISSRPFGSIDEREATLWTLTNHNGMQIAIMDFGATITSIKLPAAKQLIECVLGFDHAEAYGSEYYRQNNPHLGAIIGRHAGRISFARAPLNEQILHLSANLHQHHLHGGHIGFDQHWWELVAQHCDDHAASLTLHLFSPDGDEGYPGNLHVWVNYTLTSDNELKVNFRAQCDQDTLLNLTQHSYFNLSLTANSISQHQLWLAPRQMIATDNNMIPTGHLADVPPPLDFNKSRIIADSIIDTAFILPEKDNADMIVARLYAADSGFSLAVSTDAPILVVYNAEHLPHQAISERKSLQPFAAICFEPQGYSDAPNHAAFPNNILRKNTTFTQNINYQFNFPKIR